MKWKKNMLKLFVLVVATSLMLGGIYSLVNGIYPKDNPSENTPELPKIQIFSPQENTTYPEFGIPLNISANDAVAKIIYSINGVENITYTQDTQPLTLLASDQHQLIVYAFDDNDTVVDCKNVTFTVEPKHLTYQELEETVRYFKSQGLTVESVPHSIIIKKEIVIFEHARDFATFMNSQGVTTIQRRDEPSYVTFMVTFYGIQPTVPESFSHMTIPYNSYGEYLASVYYLRFKID
ncbi:MAG: hypothetical protein LBQ98_07550 [Nitrososphaerota archaeon]|jgi:hypothetical protein|nr:hypothetical protein [Nitrososphaerota archaeon]